MGRPSKFGEPTELIRIPVSKLAQVKQLVTSEPTSVQNLEEREEVSQDKSLYVQNQAGQRVEIPSYAVESVLQLVDALKFLHEHADQKNCWSIRFNLQDLWNRLPLYCSDVERVKLRAEILATGEVCQVVGYSVVLSQSNRESAGVDLKHQNGAIYHYGTHRVRIFIEEQPGDRSSASPDSESPDASSQ